MNLPQLQSRKPLLQHGKRLRGCLLSLSIAICDFWHSTFVIPPTAHPNPQGLGDAGAAACHLPSQRARRAGTSHHPSSRALHAENERFLLWRNLVPIFLRWAPRAPNTPQTSAWRGRADPHPDPTRRDARAAAAAAASRPLPSAENGPRCTRPGAGPPFAPSDPRALRHPPPPRPAASPPAPPDPARPRTAPRDDAVRPGDVVPPRFAGGSARPPHRQRGRLCPRRSGRRDGAAPAPRCLSTAPPAPGTVARAPGDSRSRRRCPGRAPAAEAGAPGCCSSARPRQLRAAVPALHRIRESLRLEGTFQGCPVHPPLPCAGTSSFPQTQPGNYRGRGSRY